MFKDRYLNRKNWILKTTKINASNRKIIKQFLDYQEKKLKRRQGLAEVDERSYKTLYFYIGRLVNLDIWFKHKSWKSLTKSDIRKLIDDLEDGKIKTKLGTKFKDRSLYYQMLSGKLFDLAGKSQYALEYFKEFETSGRDSQDHVRFIEEEQFRKLVDYAISQEQKCLLWLAFDIGENIGTLLELEKKDIKEQKNPNTKETEFLVILSKEKVKRSRTPRSEITNYPETSKYLKSVLKNLKSDPQQRHNEEKLFKFGRKVAEKFLKRAVSKSNVRCIPEGEPVTWKDLRSSMACDLLKKGWSRDEVNARLGHKPSSRTIDKYINYLALDRHEPKQKIYEGNLKKLESELETTKDLAKLQALRIENLKKDLKNIEEKKKQEEERKAKNLEKWKKQIEAQLKSRS